MSQFCSLVKMNIKLLLRNKIFLFFLCFAPLLSLAILGIKTESTASIESQSEAAKIIELGSPNSQTVYVGEATAYRIKVYDASKSTLSEMFLNHLAASDMFCVCRLDAASYSAKEVHELAEYDANHDKMGVAIYLTPDFDEKIMEEDYEGAFQLFIMSEDERFQMFQSEFTSLLSQVEKSIQLVGKDREKVCDFMEQLDENFPEKELVRLDGKDKISLTEEQKDDKNLIGYSFAIIILGFMFCGVCVAHTVIEEQSDKVYTRVLLSGTSQMIYLGAKFFMVVVISILQTGILGVGLFLWRDLDFGISKLVFLVMVFLLGLIFAAMSLCAGVILGEIMAANYVIFTIWSISSMLAGLYFALDFSTPVLKAVSDMMPQKWFMRACEMMFVGDNGAYSMVLCVTVAYLVLILSIGAVGIKVKGQPA